MLQPDPHAKPNNNPIQMDPPVFIKQTANGKLYRAGEGDDMFYLLHLWGKFLKGEGAMQCTALCTSSLT